MTSPTHATCHCGAVSITLARAPDEVTHCNCSLCRSYGAIWAYYPSDDVTVPDGAVTDTYAWNGRHVDFHRCANCGCVTHWVPRDAARDKRGINANLLPVEVTKAARVRYLDGASR
jgi:hypothetical protein